MTLALLAVLAVAFSPAAAVRKAESKWEGVPQSHVHVLRCKAQGRDYRCEARICARWQVYTVTTPNGGTLTYSPRQWAYVTDEVLPSGRVRGESLAFGKLCK